MSASSSTSLLGPTVYDLIFDFQIRELGSTIHPNSRSQVVPSPTDHDTLNPRKRSSTSTNIGGRDSKRKTPVSRLSEATDDIVSLSLPSASTPTAPSPSPTSPLPSAVRTHVTRQLPIISTSSYAPDTKITDTEELILQLKGGYNLVAGKHDGLVGTLKDTILVADGQHSRPPICADIMACVRTFNEGFTFAGAADNEVSIRSPAFSHLATWASVLAKDREVVRTERNAAFVGGPPPTAACRPDYYISNNIPIDIKADLSALRVWLTCNLMVTKGWHLKMKRRVRLLSGQHEDGPSAVANVVLQVICQMEMLGSIYGLISDFASYIIFEKKSANEVAIYPPILADSDRLEAELNPLSALVWLLHRPIPDMAARSGWCMDRTELALAKLGSTYPPGMGPGNGPGGGEASGTVGGLDGGLGDGGGIGSSGHGVGAGLDGREPQDDSGAGESPCGEPTDPAEPWDTDEKSVANRLANHHTTLGYRTAPSDQFSTRDGQGQPIPRPSSPSSIGRSHLATVQHSPSSLNLLPKSIRSIQQQCILIAPDRWTPHPSCQFGVSDRLLFSKRHDFRWEYTCQHRFNITRMADFQVSLLREAKPPSALGRPPSPSSPAESVNFQLDSWLGRGSTWDCYSGIMTTTAPSSSPQLPPDDIKSDDEWQYTNPQWVHWPLAKFQAEYGYSAHLMAYRSWIVDGQVDLRGVREVTDRIMAEQEMCTILNGCPAVAKSLGWYLLQLQGVDCTTGQRVPEKEEQAVYVHVMEQCDEKALEVIKREETTGAEQEAIKQSIVEAYNSIHRLGVIHGDVAWRHIRLATAEEGTKFTVKLLDFDRALLLDGPIDEVHARIRDERRELYRLFEAL